MSFYFHRLKSPVTRFKLCLENNISYPVTGRCHLNKIESSAFARAFIIINLKETFLKNTNKIILFTTGRDFISKNFNSICIENANQDSAVYLYIRRIL